MSNILDVFPKAQVITPSDGQAYQDAIRRWADNSSRNAKWVVFPESAQDVSKAINFVVANNLDVAIKGGGHSCSGASSSEDLVIDLGRLSTVVVDTERQVVKVGGGAVWEQVDREAAKFGLAAVGGTVNHTGVGGLSVGGGFGWLTAKYGLTLDNVVEAEVVTANGEIHQCSEDENADLFWAIRGGGSNFGVVTSFTYKAHPQTNTVWAGLLVFTPPQLTAIVTAVRSWALTAGENESALFFIASPPPHFKPTVALIPFYNGPITEAKEKYKAIYDVGPVADMTTEMPYEALNSIQNPLATYGDRKSFKVSAFVDLNVELITHVFEEYNKFVTECPDAIKSVVIFEFFGYKKIMSVPSTATAFVNRGPWYNINFQMRWKDPKSDDTARAWANKMTEYVQQEQGPKLKGVRGYSNYATGDERSKDVFGENYDRLAELKVKFDPDNVFKKWFPITPKA